MSYGKENRKFYSNRNSYGDKRRYGRSSSPVLHPDLEGYQLVGSSQFVRFAEQLLEGRRTKKNGLAYIGLSISGQKIKDVSKRMEDGFYPVQKNVVLMIGTNDLLQKTPLAQMRLDIENLVLQFIEKGVQHLIVLTIPPVPRLAKNYDHWYRLKDYNDLIRSYHNGEDVFVVDAYSKCVKPRMSKPSKVDSSPTDRLPNADALRISVNANGNRKVDVASSSTGALRISVNTNGKRKVCVTDGSSRELSRPTLSLKRGRYSPDSYDSPPAKRPTYSSRADDDHDDDWCEDESFDTSIADEIDMSLFEEYFGNGNRKDLIHLNNKGLRLIQKLVSQQIDKIEGNRRRNSYY